MPDNIVAFPRTKPVDQLLPHSIEFEQALLGSLLVNNELLERISWLSAHDFYDGVHGAIYGAIHRIVAAGNLADYRTIEPVLGEHQGLEELGGLKYLRRLALGAEPATAAIEYAKVLRALSQRRNLFQICESLQSETLDIANGDHASTILGRHWAALQDVCADETRPPGKRVAELVQDIIDEMENPAVRVSTSLPRLDKSLGGGLPLGGYVVGFEARPKQFKTGVLHTIAVSLARQNVETVWFALEMGSARLMKRMLGHAGRFNSAWFHYPEEELVRRVVSAERSIPDCLEIVDCPGVRFDRLQAMASDYVVRRNAKVMILDYWQLVRPESKGDNEAQFLYEVAQWSADFAKQHKVTWIIASQENRGGNSRGSDGLIMACDWLAKLYKHAVPFTHSSFPKPVETIWMDVLYNRDGSGESLGSSDQAVFYIDPNGPHLAELVQP